LPVLPVLPDVKFTGTVDTSVCNIPPREKVFDIRPRNEGTSPSLPTVGLVGAAVVPAAVGDPTPDVHGRVEGSVGTAPNPPPAAPAAGAAGAAAGVGGAAAAGVGAVASTEPAANHATTHTEKRREGVKAGTTAPRARIAQEFSAPWTAAAQPPDNPPTSGKDRPPQDISHFRAEVHSA